MLTGSYYSDTKIARGDMNNDDVINVFDSIIMRRFIANKSDPIIIDPNPIVTTTTTTTSTTTTTTTTTTVSYNDNLIEAPVKDFDSATPSTGDVKMLVFYVDFPDVQYSSSDYSASQIETELFGNGSTSYPYESVTSWFNRSSYGNLNIDGNVYTYTCSENMANYQTDGYEKLAMEVLDGMADQIDYSDYDSDNDGVIDALSFTVPLDNSDDATKQYWYGCLATWYNNPSYTIENLSVKNYIINDVMPNSNDIRYLKQTLIHELGHSMGLPDYYKYNSADWEGLNGDAGYERMDDSIGDFSSFSKLMLGWFTENEVQIASQSDTNTYYLSDASSEGSCLLLPITSNDSYNSEYFLIEYITPSGNNSDIYTSDSGIRIFHVQAEIVTTDWGSTNFKYENYSSYYQGDDKIRVLKLVNDNNGFYHSGDTVKFGTSNFAAYDSDGNQTIDTGYTITIGDIVNGQYAVTVSK